jgi:dTDP-glucose 4,6-dehydratase
VRYFVTGAAGFIGSHFVRELLAGSYGPDVTGVTVYDKLTYAGNLENLAAVQGDPRFSFVRGDICDGDLLDDVLPGHDVVVNFAAETHVDRSIHGPQDFVVTNVVGTQTILDACLRHGIPRTVHIGTDEVYGSIDEGSWDESEPLRPNSPYSAAKAAAELLVRAYFVTYGLNVSSTRCSNNYGPYQFPEKVIPLFVTNLIDGAKVPLYGDGLNVRDWLHVDDHCRGIALALERGRPGEVYNIGGENERPNLEIVQRITAAIDGAFAADPSLASRFPASPAARGEPCWSLVTYVKDRPGHDRRYAIDPTKARAELGYRPHETFETGLAKTVAWYLANERWWRAVMDGTYRQWIERNYAAR